MGRTYVEGRVGPGTGPGLGDGLGGRRSRSRATPSMASSSDDPSGIVWVEGTMPRPLTIMYFLR